jgi:hypothetical protein
MTLVITVATKHLLIQAADTRLTKNGRLCSEDLVKTTLVQCYDAKLAISYTGLAVIDAQRTDIWLYNLLTHADAWQITANDVVELIRASLTDCIPREANLRSVGLTVVVGGLALLADGRKDLVLSCITNSERLANNHFERLFQPAERFQSYTCHVDINKTYVIQINGAIDLDESITALRKKLAHSLPTARTKEDLQHIMQYLAFWIRLAHKSRKVGNLIGEDCTVVCIDSQFKMSLHYFSQNKEIQRLPNVVGQKQSFVNTVLSGVNFHSTDTSTPLPLPDGYAGVTYSQIIPIEGGLPPYTWSIVSGTLPNGLSLNQTNGLIGGVPNTKTYQPIVFTLRMADARGNITDKFLSIFIRSEP